MEPLDIVIIAASVSALVSFFVIIYTEFLKKAIQKREDLRKHSVSLDYKREKFETQLYDIISTQPIDNLIITGDQELYVRTTDKKASLSRRTIDKSFFRAMGIDTSLVKVEENFAFIAMPFHHGFDKTLEAIKGACKNTGYTAHRSDETYVTGDILRNVVTMILSSQVVIAVIDGNNPNVFYEIGIAHAIGKPVIFVANQSRMDRSKFDVEHNRIILYNNYSELQKELSDFLNKMKES